MVGRGFDMHDIIIKSLTIIKSLISLELSKPNQLNFEICKVCRIKYKQIKRSHLLCSAVDSVDSEFRFSFENGEWIVCVYKSDVRWNKRGWATIMMNRVNHQNSWIVSKALEVNSEQCSQWRSKECKCLYVPCPCWEHFCVMTPCLRVCPMFYVASHDLWL